MGCSGSRPALLVAPPTGACELEMKASSMISNDVYLVDTSGPRSAAKCLNLTHKPVEEETGNYVTAMTSTLDKSTLMVSATEIAAWDYRLSDALAAAKDWGGYDESLSPERVAELDQSYGVGKMTHYWWQMAVVTKIYKDVTMQQQLAQLTARVRGESLSESSMLTSSEGGGARVHTSQLTGLKYTLQVHGKDVPLEFKGMLNVHSSKEPVDATWSAATFTCSGTWKKDSTGFSSTVVKRSLKTNPAAGGGDPVLDIYLGAVLLKVVYPGALAPFAERKIEGQDVTSLADVHLGSITSRYSPSREARTSRDSHDSRDLWG